MGGSTTSTQQEIELSPEAQKLMAEELSLFTQQFLPAEMYGRGEALRGLGPDFATTSGAKGTARMLDIGEKVTARAGQARGIGGESLAQALAPMQEIRPEALGGMQNLYRQMATQKSSLMDPRFAQFLRPDVQTTSSSSPTAGAQAAQAASLAIAVASVVAIIAV